MSNPTRPARRTRRTASPVTVTYRTPAAPPPGTPLTGARRTAAIYDRPTGLAVTRAGGGKY